MAASKADAISAVWICAGMSITVLIARLIFCRQPFSRRFPLDVSSCVVLASIVVISARILCSYFTLEIGTANDKILQNAVDTESSSRLKTGSILALMSRLLVASLYWLQSILLLIFYSRLLSHISWVRAMIRICWAFVVASYIAVVLSTFIECRPFRLYWQTDPDPGHCIKAYGQLFTQCVSIMVIDVLLLVISFPLVCIRGQSLQQKLRLVIIYSLGSCCIIITCVRIASIYGDHSAQATRSLWASIQAVLAVLVANLPSIYGALALKRRRSSINQSHLQSQPRTHSSLSLSRNRTRDSYFMAKLSKYHSVGDGTGKRLEVSSHSSSERDRPTSTELDTEGRLCSPSFQYASILRDEIQRPDDVHLHHADYGRSCSFSSHPRGRDENVGAC